MNAKVDQHTGGTKAADIAKLVLALLVLVAGIAAYYLLGHVAHSLRILGVFAAVIVAVAIAAFTELGRAMRGFLRESQFEMRKVTWPTRDETVRTTLVVAFVVVVVAILLGIIDYVLKSIILDWLLKLGK
ncbi:MAG: preprotein translocase subunit SecE [Metallibacterium scheffleri]|jgi:preprotein translocase subunit SecE|uniref:Protein translocase subunit SecE n=1 Tax=Metallibacterium scheffleri TaxID=993689 RepID=A0A4S3KE26_9GAMM|nr:preprotein translocase subunit SecE [Metallibacterium scheffleri]THD06669.1 preprotein translocase subunit SecE [Metallibacterium scheffleri]